MLRSRRCLKRPGCGAALPETAMKGLSVLNHLAARALFVLLLVSAAVVASAGVTPAQAAVSPDLSARSTAAPKVVAYGGMTRRGFRHPFHFRVQGEGPVTVRLTVTRKGRLAISATMKRVNPILEYHDTWLTPPIAKSFPGLVYYSFCVAATDNTGRRAKHCDKVMVV